MGKHYSYKPHSRSVGQKISLVNENQRLRNALFWAVTQRVVIISYRLFGTTYRSHLEGRLSRNFGKKITTIRCE